MKGIFGKFLDVNLTKEKITEYTIPGEWSKKYLGGRGIGARILIEEMEGGEEPLGPENILIFGTGPLQGIPLPGSGRHVVMAKSPKTGGVSGSYAGGFFANELGTSGYDGIILRGESDSPKFLALIDGEAEIEDAEKLWGKEVADVDSELKDRYDGGKVSCIGKAGENLVKFSCIINDRNRAAGRPGFGAVMGSKNLKAVIVKGNSEKPIKDEGKLNDARSDFLDSLSPALDWGKIGSGGTLKVLNSLGILPTKNFQTGYFEDADQISGERMTDEILKDRDNCTGCPIRCKRVVETEFRGKNVEGRYGGPEYETLASFGSMCLNNDLDAIALANQECNKYGLDTISTGNTIAFMMEASEKGIIEKDVEWGDSEAIIELIEKIAEREGIGDLLAKGIEKVAEEINASDFAMEIKGQEIPFHEPRGKKAHAISYATNPRGANHLDIMHEHFQEHPEELEIEAPINRLSLKKKPRYNKVYEDLMSFTNSAIMCWYASFDVQNMGNYVYPEIRKIMKAVTGLEIDVDRMLKIGERNYNLLKILAGREGITKEKDGLPERFKEPLPEGPSEGESIPENELEKKIEKYYDLRGWNKFGPTQEKVDELGIDLKVGELYSS